MSSCNLVQPLEPRTLLSAGDLDTTFATGGEFKFGFGSHAVFHDVAVQSDGKIVAVGAVDPEKAHPKVLVARFTANGKLDKTFSGDGFDVTALGARGSVARKLLLLDHGKFLVAGGGPGGSGFIARYSSNGNLDPAFGKGGVVHEGGGAITDLALASSDRLVAVNLHSVFRFHSYKGNLDGVFGRGGVASVALHDLPSFSAACIAVDADGKIVVGGTTVDFSSSEGLGDPIVLRLKSSGVIDKTFGENGVTDEYVAGDDSAFAVQVLPDKKILLETAGEVGNNELIVLDRNGHDIGDQFDNQHSVGFDFNSGNFSSFGGFIHDYVRRSNGSIVAAGEADDEDNNPFIVVVGLRPDFSVDPKFHHAGQTNPIPGVPRAIALTSSGDVILVGATTFVETADSEIPSGQALLVKFRAR